MNRLLHCALAAVALLLPGQAAAQDGATLALWRTAAEIVQREAIIETVRGAEAADVAQL